MSDGIVGDEDRLDYEGFDLKVYINMIQKWKWLVIGITALAVVTSVLFSFFVLSPVYLSKAVIMVKEYQDPKTIQGGNQKDDLESVVGSLSRLPQMTIKTYVGQLENEALLRRVIDLLKLDKLIYSPKTVADLIDVNAIPDTNLIEVSVKNNDPQLAATIANTLAEQFVEFVGTENEKQLVSSSAFLTKQLAKKENELKTAVDKLNKHRSQERNLVYLEQEVANKNQNLSTNQFQLLQVEADYRQAVAGKSTAEQKLSSIPEKIRLKRMDPASGQSVEVEEINPAYSELSQLITVKTVEIAGLEAKKQGIQEAVDRLQTDLKSLQVELHRTRQIDDQLQEEVSQIKQTRDVLADKLTQIQIAKSMDLGRNSLQIVTPAFAQDKPVSPKKTLNMAIAFTLGLMFSAVIAFVLELMNNTINKSEDIEQYLGLPILGIIPLAKAEDME